MAAFDRALKRISSDLAKLHVQYALVGGIAVAAQGEPRFTSDFDFAIAVSGDAEAEAIVGGLLRLGYTADRLIEDDRGHDLVTVHMSSPPVSGAKFPVDLLFNTTGVEREVVASAAPIEILPRLTLPVAARGHLIAMKVLSAGDNRLRDFDDLRGLIVAAAATDLLDASAMLDLITARGKGRGRDLQAELRGYLQRFTPPAP